MPLDLVVRVRGAKPCGGRRSRSLTAREDPEDQASSRSWPASGLRRPRSAVRRPEPAFAPRTRTTTDGRYWSQLNGPSADKSVVSKAIALSALGPYTQGFIKTDLSPTYCRVVLASRTNENGNATSRGAS